MKIVVVQRRKIEGKRNLEDVIQEKEIMNVNPIEIIEREVIAEKIVIGVIKKGVREVGLDHE